MRLHPTADRSFEMIFMGVKHGHGSGEHRESLGSAEYVAEYRLAGHIAAVGDHRLVGVSEYEGNLFQLALSDGKSGCIRPCG